MILCLVSRKIYIGKTDRTFFERYPNGKWWKNTNNRFLLADYKRYGEDNFVVRLVDQHSDPVELHKLEARYIGHYKTMYPDGYNLLFDLSMHPDPEVAHIYYSGIVGKRCGMTDPDELITKEELCAHMIATRTPEQRDRCRQAVSRAQKGKTLSPEHRAIISRTHKGFPLAAEHIAKIKHLATERQGKTICQYTIDGHFIAEHPSINEAARRLGLERRCIGQAVNGRSASSGGFVWRLKT